MLLCSGLVAATLMPNIKPCGVDSTDCPACGAQHPHGDGANGKPDLAGTARGALAFNLSHSGDRALIGRTSGVAIGVDVEALRALPDATRIYGGHEYTQSNARFAVAVDPDNALLAARAAEIDAMREAGKSTVPSTLGSERGINPFLRADDPAMQAAVGIFLGD